MDRIDGTSQVAGRMRALGTMLGSGGPLSFKLYPSEKSDGRNQATLILIDNSDSERLVEPIDGPGIHRMWL